MKNTLTKISIAGAIISMTSMLVVSAAPSTSTSSNAKQETAKVQDKELKAIDKRVENLNELILRMRNMRNFTEEQKTAVTNTIQGLIVGLEDIKAKIQNSTSTEALKTDREALAKLNRVYALFMPQINIIRSADRIMTIFNIMAFVGPKLEIRMGQMATSTYSANIEVMNNFKAKLLEARTIAQSVVNEVIALLPDGGDKTKMADNAKALKEARAKIQTAHKNLLDARKDAQTILDSVLKADKELLKTVNTMNSQSKATTTGTSTGQ